VALVIDEVHILHNQEYWAALSMLADHVPVSSGSPCRAPASWRDAQLRSVTNRRQPAWYLVE
jgi:hypothetical protein